MYKKITKIKKVTKKYSSPAEERADDSDDTNDDNSDDSNVETEVKIYGDTVNMDIPFFIKLLEHVHTKIATPVELQAFADTILSASKQYPVLTGEWFEKLI